MKIPSHKIDNKTISFISKTRNNFAIHKLTPQYKIFQSVYNKHFLDLFNCQ